MSKIVKDLIHNIIKVFVKPFNYDVVIQFE